MHTLDTKSTSKKDKTSKKKKKTSKKDGKMYVNIDVLKESLGEIIDEEFVTIDGKVYSKEEIEKIHDEWVQTGRIR